MTSPAGLFAPVRVATPVVEAGCRLWLDVSNWQGPLGPDWFSTWSARGYGGLIVQAVTGTDGRTFTRQQLQAALNAGWFIASYVWCNAGDHANTNTTLNRLELLDPFREYLDFIALDVEEMALIKADVDADLLLLDDYLEDRSPIYTGKWVFDRLGWSDNAYWADRRLWASIYDGTPEVDFGFVPFGGWTQAWMKQFTDRPFDQNICRV